MPNVFLTADAHFGQGNAIKFFRQDGVTPLRPFNSVEEMDEILARLNGDKVLIRGNHDIFKLSDYLPYFRDVRATHLLDNCILSHIPLHPESLKRWMGGNIHGHLHDRTLGDPRYFCVSVEQTNFKPIALEEVRRLMRRNYDRIAEACN